MLVAAVWKLQDCSGSLHYSRPSLEGCRWSWLGWSPQGGYHGRWDMCASPSAVLRRPRHISNMENCYPALQEENLIACFRCLAQLSTKPLHAFVCIICACQLFWLIQHFSFWFHDSHYFFCSFHDGPATEQAATCEWLYATETDNDGSHVAGREHSDHFCIFAVILCLWGGPATEQAKK